MLQSLYITGANYYLLQIYSFNTRNYRLKWGYNFSVYLKCKQRDFSVTFPSFNLHQIRERLSSDSAALISSIP